MLNIIYHCSRKRCPIELLAVDIEKVLDSVESLYLKVLLIFMGFGEHFLKAIQGIYSAPPTVIRINGVCSDQIVLSRGTRQGCWLSPVLFALAIEPLVAAIHSNLTIKGVVIGKKEYKLSLFANDIVLYINDPCISIPETERLLEDFGRVSGLRVNQLKTELYPVSLGGTLGDRLRMDYPFKWIAKAWR